MAGQRPNTRIINRYVGRPPRVTQKTTKILPGNGVGVGSSSGRYHLFYDQYYAAAQLGKI